MLDTKPETSCFGRGAARASTCVSGCMVCQRGEFSFPPAARKRAGILVAEPEEPVRQTIGRIDDFMSIQRRLIRIGPSPEAEVAEKSINGSGAAGVRD